MRSARALTSRVFRQSDERVRVSVSENGVSIVYESNGRGRLND